MKNRIISLITAITLLFLFSVPTFAVDEFTITNGVLYSYNGTDNMVTIPENVYRISDNAFKNNTNLKIISLSDNTYYIGNEAFSGCTALNEIINDSQITFIGANAFENTALVTENTQDFVTVNNICVKYKGNSAEITIPNNIIGISGLAFSGNETLQSLVISSNVTYIGERAFDSCTALENVEISPLLSRIDALAFNNTPWLMNYSEDFVVVGNGILLAYLGNDKKIKIPDTVTQIASAAFAGNDSLVDVTIQDGCISVGNGAFADCTSLSSILIPNSVRAIASSAFANVGNLLIKGSASSYAEAFALENSFNYKVFHYGDVDSDLILTSADAIIILQYYANIITVIDVDAADINFDNLVNSEDAIIILQIYAGILS